MRTCLVGVSVGLLLIAPAAAAPVPTGFAVVAVDEGCLARVVRGPYKKIVDGRTELPTGRYRLKVRPAADCTATPARLRIREGRTVRARVTFTPSTP